jgi:hypothetical protein
LDFELSSEKAPADPTAKYTSCKPFVSGTAVFEGGDKGSSTIKMIVTAPPYKTVSEYIDHHHGIEGVKTYLQATAFGRDLKVGNERDLKVGKPAQYDRIFIIKLSQFVHFLCVRFCDQLQLATQLLPRPKDR